MTNYPESPIRDLSGITHFPGNWDRRRLPTIVPDVPLDAQIVTGIRFLARLLQIKSQHSKHPARRIPSVPFFVIFQNNRDHCVYRKVVSTFSTSDRVAHLRSSPPDSATLDSKIWRDKRIWYPQRSSVVEAFFCLFRLGEPANPTKTLTKEDKQWSSGGVFRHAMVTTITPHDMQNNGYNLPPYRVSLLCRSSLRT